MLKEDAARLSPFVRKHLGVYGTYSSPYPTWSPALYGNSATPTPRMRKKTDLAGGA